MHEQYTRTRVLVKKTAILECHLNKQEHCMWYQRSSVRGHHFTSNIKLKGA